MMVEKEIARFIRAFRRNLLEIPKSYAERKFVKWRLGLYGSIAILWGGWLFCTALTGMLSALLRFR